MTEPYVMSAEELRLTPIETGAGPTGGARVRSHIAALEARIAEFEGLVARGGTMTAEAIAEIRHDFDLGNNAIWEEAPENTEAFLDHFAAQGARIAALEKHNLEEKRAAEVLRKRLEASLDAEAKAQQHISDLEKSLENVRKERDEWEAAFHRVNIGLTERLLAAERERDEALADKAAFMLALSGVVACPDRRSYGGGAAHAKAAEVCRQPHPGAALLERMKRLEEYARKGLHAYHNGVSCPYAHGTRPENPAECEHAECREWAKALEWK